MPHQSPYIKGLFFKKDMLLFKLYKVMKHVMLLYDQTAMLFIQLRPKKH